MTPKKYPQNSNLKIFVFLKTLKIIEIQNFEPQKMTRGYVCMKILEYLPGVLITDASLAADPGLESMIPVRSHSFVEIDHEIISMVILLPSTESFNKGCCQL